LCEVKINKKKPIRSNNNIFRCCWLWK
jgi:hypothetical protein